MNAPEIAPSFTVEARSARLDGAGPRLAVTVPTFRRPDHLRRTLASLRFQEPGVPFVVVVIENDAERQEGLAVAREMLATGDLEGLAVLQRERGNCSAYNAGWETALAEFPALEFVGVIDDDEIADPAWARSLLETAERLGADIVGGPQRPLFDDPRAERLRRHPVFAPPYGETGIVPILYSSGNVLLRRRVLDVMPKPFLDPEFNFLGGGDSDFYSRARARNFRFAWANEAVVMETMPARRTDFSWIHARALRNGTISAMIERRAARGPTDRLRSLAKSAALLAASPFRSAKLGFETGSALAGLYHMQVAFGRFQAMVGSANEQYRRPENN